jgi:hypothetical protein
VTAFNDWVTSVCGEKKPVFVYHNGDHDELIACLNNNIKINFSHCIEMSKAINENLTDELENFGVTFRYDPLSQASQLACLMKTRYGSDSSYLELSNLLRERKQNFACLDDINPTTIKSREKLNGYTVKQLNFIMKQLSLKMNHLRRDKKIEAIMDKQKLKKEREEDIQAEEHMSQSISDLVIQIGGYNPNYPSLKTGDIKMCYKSLSRVISSFEFNFEKEDIVDLLQQMELYESPPYSATYFHFDGENNIRVLNDGNTFFRCLSLFLFGFEDGHIVLRCYTLFESGDELTESEIREIAKVGCEVDPNLLSFFQKVFGFRIVLSSNTCPGQENGTLHLTDCGDGY